MSDQKAVGVILGKAQLLAHMFADTTSGRYAMQTVNVLADGTVEATNGHYAIRVKPSGMPAEEWPSAAVPTDAAPIDKAVSIPVETIKAALAAIPKRSTIPILACALVASDGHGGATVTTTDLERTQTARLKGGGAGFPDLDNIMPNDDPALTIGFNPDYLADICAYAKKVGARSVKVEYWTPDKPARFTIKTRGAEAIIILMPMRVSG